MTVGDLITHLKQFEHDREIVVFASGEIYPILDIQDLRGKDFNMDEIELGCGWKPMEFTDD